MNVLQLCIDRRIPLVVATTGHTAECAAGLELLDCSIDTLEWVLGDNHTLDGVVAHVVTAAALRC